MSRNRIALLFAAVVAGAASVHAADPKSPKPKIVLAGDSTVTDAAGWGKAFAESVEPRFVVVNAARGGQSSKSFYDGGNWRRALDEKPDFVLIQFGHNDQPGKGPHRETDPQTTYREYLRRYVDEARAAGAQPVLVTSLARRIFTPEGTIRPDQVPYVEAMRAVAQEQDVPLVDLYALSVELAERTGPEASKRLGPPHPTISGEVDGTHLSEKGAAVIAPLVVRRLAEVVPELRPQLPASTK